MSDADLIKKRDQWLDALGGDVARDRCLALDDGTKVAISALKDVIHNDGLEIPGCTLSALSLCYLMGFDDGRSLQ